jgi:hypothetical protein
LFQAGGVEVDVGDGGEQGFDDEMIEGTIQSAELAGAMDELADTFGGMEEQILEGGGLGIFAANAGVSAAGGAESLFALITEHRFGC